MNKLSDKTILVTGSAGFIGFHTTKALLEQGAKVIGLDNLNNYYDPSLKEARNEILKKYENYKFYKGDLENLDFIKKIFADNQIDKICHLAAQAGVRYSITNPHTYIQSNIVGFTNLIEEAKNHNVKDFIYASSSSVYGKNKKIPFSTEDAVDMPISLYAASKKANELIAHSYYHLFGMNCTGLRFFTVYGPYGRPDMALFLFTKAILEDKTIKVFNHGKMKRDFTYIDDIVSGILMSLDKAYPYEIFNLGNNRSVELNYFIETIEKNLGKVAKKEMLDMQAGDVAETFADIEKSKSKLNFEPQTSIEEGIKKFLDWYREYYKIK
jgi:UDP-glucuronate 4-epimerase